MQGHAHKTRTSEYDERKRGWKRCECPVFVSGTLQEKFKRHNTGLWKFDAARSIAGQFEAAGSWDSVPSQPQSTSFLAVAANQPNRITISEACKLFLAKLAETEQRGYFIDQWEPLDVRQFRSTWPVSPQTGVRRMAMMKPFFEYCVSNKWLPSNPARAVKNPKGREDDAQRTEISVH
jgi:hypothetical protein